MLSSHQPPLHSGVELALIGDIMSRPVIHTDILLRLIRSGSLQRADKVLDKLHPADIAMVLGELRPAEARQLLELLFSQKRAGKTLSELPEELLPKFLEMLTDDRLGQVLLRVPPDDAIMFLDALSPERRESALSHIEDRRTRQSLERLLRYPPGTAGNVMTPLFLALSRDATAQEAIEVVRTRGEQVEAIFYLYVVDNAGLLQGVVPIRRLVTAPADRTLEKIMLADPVVVLADSPQEEVARLVARYNLLALPVVDDSRKLLGIITVDDVIDVIQEEATQDMYRLAGLAEEDRVFSPMGTSIKKRLPWMSINLGTAFMAAAVIGTFEGTISQKVVLASFLPVVAGMGGNMGTQTLTVITRGIALGEFNFARAASVVAKNMGVGLAVGAITGAGTAIVATLWKEDPRLGLVLFLAMMTNLSLAGLVGSVVPVLLKRFNQDPALGGSVVTTTFTDVGGFLAFLGIARLVFDLK